MATPGASALGFLAFAPATAFAASAPSNVSGLGYTPITPVRVSDTRSTSAAGGSDLTSGATAQYANSGTALASGSELDVAIPTSFGRSPPRSADHHLVRPITTSFGRSPPRSADHHMAGNVTGPELDARDSELAEYYGQHREGHQWDEPEAVQRPDRLEVTISVRFTRNEVAAVRARAEAAGLEPTAHIRRCALEAEEPPIDRGRLSQSVAALERDLEELRRSAG